MENAGEYDYFQEEVAHRLSEASNPERMDFVRRLLNIMPDEELKKVEILAHNAIKRRCRIRKKGTAILRNVQKTSIKKTKVATKPVLGATDSVPVSVSSETEPVSVSVRTSPVFQPQAPTKQGEGWYRKYGEDKIIFIDVEKVEMKLDPATTTKNAKGKPKLYELKAGEVAVCSLNGKKLYEAKIFREPGSFRVNPFAKNHFDSPACLSDGKPLETVQKELLELFREKLIVGIDVANDFESLDLEFGRFSKDAFDLQWHYYDETYSSKGRLIRERWSLKRMCQDLLHVSVQAGNHSAFSDACSTALVFREHYMKIIPVPTVKLN